MSIEEFQRRLDAAIAADDLNALEALQKEIVETPEALSAFQPAVTLRGVGDDEDFEGNIAIGLANGLSRAIRSARFRRKLRRGYTGPIIVSEGDSWFQYPVILDDVIDNLAKPYAICSLGAAGDTLENMQAESEYLNAIEREKANVFLFSASGNDVIGEGNLIRLIHEFEPGMEISDVIRRNAVEQTLAAIEASYQAIISEALNVNPRISILLHGYDRVLPRPNGRWLGKPLETRKVPRSLWPGVAAALIDQLNEQMAVLESRFPGNVRHIDCRGYVGQAVVSWYDEIHPRNKGFRRVAEVFEAQIEDMLQRSRGTIAGDNATLVRAPRTDTAIVAVQEDAAVNEALIDVGADIQVHQPVQLTKRWSVTESDRSAYEDCKALLTEPGRRESAERIRARRGLIANGDDAAFERILGRSNLFPINYLSRGARQARAVAKISLRGPSGIPMGSGTGFLVAPGLLLTNNHVIPDRETARRAIAIFGYAEDAQYEPMPTRKFEITDAVFFTSDKSQLDFTFVSVVPVSAKDDELSEFGQFTLLEDSGKALKDEYVSIIQHPWGQMKQIALRDSKVIGVKGDFIYYTSDTDAGASGSPVLNDDWLPVALHHKTVPNPEKPGEYIANRGVRISQIFRRLRAAQATNDPDAINILKALGAIQLSSNPAPVDARVIRPQASALQAG